MFFFLSLILICLAYVYARRDDASFGCVVVGKEKSQSARNRVREKERERKKNGLR